MAARGTTMQDIARACGLSRNTVSKVFNGSATVREATRQAVLEKARELNYRQLAPGPDEDEEKPERRPSNRSVAVFTTFMPSASHFGSLFISAFANRLTRAGYNILMYEITPEELRSRRLPESFALHQTAGILGIELFDRDYSDFVCELRLPAIFADTYACADFSAMGADVISMENTACLIQMTEKLIASGARRLGFLGDRGHCASFYERWSGFRAALDRAGLPYREDLCVLEKDGSPYDNSAWLAEQLERMPELPDAFVCANDYLAIHLMRTLKKKGVRIPEDIMIAGFDGSPESAFVDPPLTTVQIPSSDMGTIAAGILLERMENPTLPYRRTYLQTKPIWRKTTRRISITHKIERLP